ncbi:hypothetical protein [Bradyrhizobium sp. USDA 4501]
MTRRRPRCNTHPDDKQRLNEILSDFKRSARAGQPAERRPKPRSADAMASSIRGFSCWLYEENKPGIVVRPHDRSLDEDAELYRSRGGRRIITPGLAHLRNFMLGTSALELSRRRLAAYPEDETLIQKAVDAAKADIVNGTPWQGFGTPRDINKVASCLRGFSEWLKTHAKSAIAGRLNDPSLQEDRKTYTRVKNRQSRHGDLNLLSMYNLLEPLLRAAPAAAAMRDEGLELRTHLALLEQEMEVDGPTEISEGDPQLNSFQESLEQLLVVPSTPLELPTSPVDWTERTNERALEASSSAVEAHRASSSAPEQMRSEPRDLGASSVGADHGAPSRERHDSRSGNEPWSGHQSPLWPSVPNPGAGPAVDSDHDVREPSTAVVRTAVTRRRPQCSIHPGDRERLNEILNDFKRSARAVQPAARRLKPRSAMVIASSIRGFSCWLYEENKPGIVVRPHDRSLDEDAQLYISSGGGRRIITAGLAHLRNFMLGTSSLKLSRSRLAAYPDDETLIQKAVDAARADLVNGTPWQGFGTPRDITKAASYLRGFSEWLKTHAKSAIAGRLGDPLLQEDRKTYRRVKNSQSRRGNLNLLSTYNSRRKPPASAISDSDLDLLELLEQEMEVEGPPSTAGDIAPQHTLLQTAPAAAAMRDDGLALRTYLALLEEQMEVDGPTEIWEGDPQLNSFQASLEQLLFVPSTPLEPPTSPLQNGSSNFDTALRGEARNYSENSRASWELGRPQHSSHPVVAISAWAPAHDFGQVVPFGLHSRPPTCPRHPDWRAE